MSARLTRNRRAGTPDFQSRFRTQISLEPRLLLAADAGQALCANSEPSADVASFETTEIAFVDSSVSDLATLLDKVPDNAEIVLLDPQQDALEQITNTLTGRTEIQALHFISHGSGGEINMAGDSINEDSLHANEQLIRQWGTSLSNDADILIYGCDVASSDAGRDFTQLISKLTGADVAASTDITGSVKNGGDWVLEYSTGAIETPLLVSQNARHQYSGTLLITIDAAGATGQEILELQIDGQTVAQFNGVGGDIGSRSFQQLSYNNQTPVTADQIRLLFTNDQFIPGGYDRNLVIDRIDIDGQAFQTEHDSTFSTATWNPINNATVPGNLSSEWMHSNGFVQFANQNATTIDVTARGITGEEIMQVSVGGQVVGSYEVSTSSDVYSLSLDRVLDPTADTVRVEFVNDAFDPGTGSDRNLVVDQISVNGVVLQSESSTTYSTATWNSADGFSPGYGRGEWLQINGHFQYDSPPSEITVRALGEEGFEQLQLQINQQTVATYDVSQAFQDFTYAHSAPITANDIRVLFDGDVYEPENGIDTTLIVDWIEVDGRRIESESPYVFSTGTFSDIDNSITPGYGRGHALDGDGYFQYATGSTVTVRAEGDAGVEDFDLVIDGLHVGNFAVTDSAEDYIYIAQGLVAAKDVRIEFNSNELQRGETADRNLKVESIEIDGEEYETDEESTYSSGAGVYNNAVLHGFGNGDKLYFNGFFQFHGVQVNNDAFSIPEDAVAIPLAVLANDISSFYNTVDVVSFTNPSNGSLQIVDGRLQYTPNANFVGTDSFTYKIESNNGSQQSDSASVSIVVNESHQQPQSLINPAIASELSPSGKTLDVRRLVKIPLDENGRHPRMNSMATYGDRIFVVTDGLENNQGRIYELVTDATGNTSAELFFDAGPAIFGASGLELDNRQPLFGLASVAFHPKFSSNGKFFVTYTGERPADPSQHYYLSDPANPVEVDSVLAEWTFDFQTNQVDPDSFREVFRVGMIALDHPIRNAVFNPFAQPGDDDYGLLYIGHGDGSVQSAIAGDGQNGDALGKILRVDPLQSGELPFTVPTSNPFVDSIEFPREVYAYGFRNPHNLTFAQDATGIARLVVTEIGRDNIEEINIVEKGLNYGWGQREGVFTHIQGLTGININIIDLPVDDALNDYVYPVSMLGHDGPVGATFVGQAIAGGHVIANGSSELNDQFIFLEFATDGRAYHIDFSDALSQTTTTLDPNDPNRDDSSDLTWLTPQELTILFDHDDDPSTDSIAKASLKDVLDDEPDFEEIISAGKVRADLRLGQGPNGELLIMNKRNGWVYIVSNTIV